MASLNEALGEVGGVSFPYQNLYNTMGIGNATPAQQAGQTAADQSSPASNGSGDKFPALLPMALQVAARTIGFDLVNTTPFAGPTGVIPFMDYVYSNGKEPYGASPSYSKATANPEFAVGGPEAGEAWKRYDMPSSFRAKMTLDASVFTTKRAAATAMKDAGRITLGGSLVVEFIDLARLSADPMFKVVTKGTKSLGEIFDVEDGVEVIPGVTIATPRLISMLEDQIQGFAGAGKYDSAKWSGTFQDPHSLYEPMDRATGEQQYPRQLSLKVHTKFVQVGTIDVAVAVTQEQVQDLQKQWGVDVLKMVEKCCN